MSKNIVWGGTHPFSITGAAIHEDTLRIKAGNRQTEKNLQLKLPTLCITFADAKFQNAIGGEQLVYPDSKRYGNEFFKTAITLTGEAIERLTYIRGASKVIIGAETTIIDFPSYKELVIPRMRINKKKSLTAELNVPKLSIAKLTPLAVEVRQFADGRHVGGVKLEKRHPEWISPQIQKVYELYIHVLDGLTGKPMVKTPVDLFRWDPAVKTPYGNGTMTISQTVYTDRNGNIHIAKRPAEELDAYFARMPQFRSVVRCMRPLSGQKVRIHLRLWPLKRLLVPYILKENDFLDNLAEQCGYPVSYLLEINKIKNSSMIKAGERIILPCNTAAYRMEPWDTIDSIAKMFDFKNAKELANTMKLSSVDMFDFGKDIIIPGYFFIYARKTDTLDSLDKQFGLDSGSCKVIGRVFRPNPRIPYSGEIVAVPIK